MDDESTAMRQEIDQTLARLTENLGKLEQQLSETVKTVQDSVGTVRDSLDVKLHVRQRPWTLLAGATVLGFLSGLRSHNSGAARGARANWSARTFPTRAASADRPNVAAADGVKPHDGMHLSAAAGQRWLASLGDTFRPEIAELKGIVIGSLLELARQMVMTKRVSKQVEHTVNDGGNGTAKDAESMRSPASGAAST